MMPCYVMNKNRYKSILHCSHIHVSLLFFCLQRNCFTLQTHALVRFAYSNVVQEMWLNTQCTMCIHIYIYVLCRLQVPRIEIKCEKCISQCTGSRLKSIVYESLFLDRNENKNEFFCTETLRCGIEIQNIAKFAFYSKCWCCCCSRIQYKCSSKDGQQNGKQFTFYFNGIDEIPMKNSLHPVKKGGIETEFIVPH